MLPYFSETLQTWSTKALHDLYSCYEMLAAACSKTGRHPGRTVSSKASMMHNANMTSVQAIRILSVVADQLVTLSRQGYPRCCLCMHTKRVSLHGSCRDFACPSQNCTDCSHGAERLPLVPTCAYRETSEVRWISLAQTRAC